MTSTICVIAIIGGIAAAWAAAQFGIVKAAEEARAERERFLVADATCRAAAWRLVAASCLTCSAEAAIAWALMSEAFAPALLGLVLHAVCVVALTAAISSYAQARSRVMAEAADASVVRTTRGKTSAIYPQAA